MFIFYILFTLCSIIHTIISTLYLNKFRCPKNTKNDNDYLFNWWYIWLFSGVPDEEKKSLFHDFMFSDFEHEVTFFKTRPERCDLYFCHQLKELENVFLFYFD